MSLTLQIKYKPHSEQMSFHESEARFRSMACERRWGKTISGANEIIKMLKSYGMTNIKLNLHGDTADKITVKITGQMNRK